MPGTDEAGISWRDPAIAAVASAITSSAMRDEGQAAEVTVETTRRSTMRRLRHGGSSDVGLDGDVADQAPVAIDGPAAGAGGGEGDGLAACGIGDAS